MLRSALALLLLCFSGCASFRSYHTPLTAAEGALAVPALVSTAESMGLSAWSSGTSAQVKLEDGTTLTWNGGSNGAFLLFISLGEGDPAADVEVRFREARVRADQVWELAMQARQQNSVGAAVLVSPPGGADGASVGSGRPARPARPGRDDVSQSAGASGGGCRSGLDCGSGQFCKAHQGGGKVCMGNGGAGAPCASSIDCASMHFCRSGACAR